MKNFGLLLLLILMSGLLSACGQENAEAEANVPYEEREYPSTITIGTASQGGTYYIWGGGLATLLENHLGVTSNVEVTGGPVHNMQLMDMEDVQLGMVTEGPLYEGYYDKGVWTNKEYKDIRVIFPMYDTPFNWFSLKSTGVESIHEHEGKRVGVGPAGGTPGTYNPIVYDILGIEPSKQISSSASDMVSQMLDGQLKHIGFSAGMPISAVVEAENQADINIYGLNKEDRQKLLDELPYFQEFTIPDGTYDSQEGDIKTVSQFNYGAAHKNANADFIYDLVKTYHENIDQMISTHNSASEAKDPEVILRNKEYPLHIGAIRYYEEIGVDIPKELYPEEWYEENMTEEKDEEETNNDSA